ncbi:MAG: phage tail tape measure protein, partial [Hyphomonas sp.]
MANAVIGALRVNLGLDSAQFSKGLKQSQSALQKFGKRMAVVGAGVSAAGAGIALAMRGQLNAADDMGKLAQKIGIPVDELSRLKHAADMSGVSMGSVQGAVMRLSRAMAATPDKFNKIGVSVREVNGAMRPTSEVMADVAQVLSGMPDGAEKTALAMEYLGRSGADLIPMMNGGRDALKGMFDEADDLGIVISPEMAKNAELFNDNISRLTKQFSGLWTMIAANLAPAL